MDYAEAGHQNPVNHRVATRQRVANSMMLLIINVIFPPVRLRFAAELEIAVKIMISVTWFMAVVRVLGCRGVAPSHVTSATERW